MFGGWTTAVELRAVTRSAAGEAEPSVISVNFIAKIEPETMRHFGDRGESPIAAMSQSVETADHRLVMVFRTK